MRAQDIDKIASAVVANLSGGDAQLMGCGSISSTIAYESEPVYSCVGSYACGGAATFTCVEIFDCANDFYCGEGFQAGCGQAQQFDCLEMYGPNGICQHNAQFSCLSLADKFSI